MDEREVTADKLQRLWCNGDVCGDGAAVADEQELRERDHESVGYRR